MRDNIVRQLKTRIYSLPIGYSFVDLSYLWSLIYDPFPPQKKGFWLPFLPQSPPITGPWTERCSTVERLATRIVFPYTHQKIRE